MMAIFSTGIWQGVVFVLVCSYFEYPWETKKCTGSPILSPELIYIGEVGCVDAAS